MLMGAGAAGNGQAMLHVALALVALERRQRARCSSRSSSRLRQRRRAGRRRLAGQQDLQHLPAGRDSSAARLTIWSDRGRRQAVRLVDDQNGAVRCRSFSASGTRRASAQLAPVAPRQPAVPVIVVAPPRRGPAAAAAAGPPATAASCPRSDGRVLRSSSAPASGTSVVLPTPRSPSAAAGRMSRQPGRQRVDSARRASGSGSDTSGLASG